MAGNPIAKRTLLAGLAAAPWVRSAAAQPAGAEAFPSRPIRMVVPYAAGGPLDVLGRPLAERLRQSLGVPVVLDNRVGGGGIVGQDIVAKAPPDGYTLLLQSAALTANIGLGVRMPHDPLRDLAPVTRIADTYGLVLVVRPDRPWRDVAAVVQAARARPGEMSYGMSGFGNTTHLSGELFKLEAGIDLITVPYRGTGISVTEVIAGNVDMTFASLPTVIGQIRDGELRPLVFTGPHRAPVLPDVPTMREAGYPEAELASWYAFWVTAGTPPDRILRLQAETARALEAPEVKRVLDDTALLAVASTPDDFATFLRRDVERQTSIAKRLNLQTPIN
ncbi:Bug family tripartite tricarboxylate transporter substrate binding protein [Roseomonas sp. BN140053]|uniref:Bug family tripartite tricarboxylate transporter substrate binding protein n=1 Tax=Roseomonas sp. BN140053 TaxID=3391898 RepID=UPI0039E9CEBA